MQRRTAKNRHSDARTPAETKISEIKGRKSTQKARERALSEKYTVREDWMVEIVGLELETHHPVIEPVSPSGAHDDG
jgi:hypothetical protein